MESIVWMLKPNQQTLNSFLYLSFVLQMKNWLICVIFLMKMELKYCIANLPICMCPFLVLLLLCKVWVSLLLDNLLKWNFLFRVLYPTSRPCHRCHICPLNFDCWIMKPSKLKLSFAFPHNLTEIYCLSFFRFKTHMVILDRCKVWIKSTMIILSEKWRQLA